MGPAVRLEETLYLRRESAQRRDARPPLHQAKEQPGGWRHRRASDSGRIWERRCAKRARAPSILGSCPEVRRGSEPCTSLCASPLLSVCVHRLSCLPRAGVARANSRIPKSAVVSHEHGGGCDRDVRPAASVAGSEWPSATVARRLAVAPASTAAGYAGLVIPPPSARQRRHEPTRVTDGFAGLGTLCRDRTVPCSARRLFWPSITFILGPGLGTEVDGRDAYPRYSAVPADRSSCRRSSWSHSSRESRCACPSSAKRRCPD